MNNFIYVLEGSEVLISVTEGQINLLTSSGWSMAIYNKYYLASHDGHHVEPVDGWAKTISSVVLSKEEAFIEFSDGCSLHVDLSLEGYLGPEAMQLSGPNGEIIIWN